MFYKELYSELGKLFLYIAGIDGKVSAEERETLQKCIIKTWKPVEDSTDRYGTDRAYLIEFAFEFEEAEGVPEDYFESFASFYEQNKSSFTPAIISNILQTAKAIAASYRGKNKKEKEVLDRLNNLFKK